MGLVGWCGGGVVVQECGSLERLGGRVEREGEGAWATEIDDGI